MNEIVFEWHGLQNTTKLQELITDVDDVGEYLMCKYFVHTLIYCYSTWKFCVG